MSLHCKAGKGRAGIMAACLMVRMGETAHTAVASFDAVRSKGGGGALTLVVVPFFGLSTLNPFYIDVFVVFIETSPTIGTSLAHFLKCHCS